MNLKNKLVALAAIAGLAFINAASAEVSKVKGNVGTKYTSDYNHRGALLSQEALQAQVGFNTNIGGVDLFGDFFTNQTTDSTSADTDEFTFGLGKDLFEGALSAYAGIYNVDTEGDSADAEGFLSLKVNTLLQPTLNYFRNTDEELNTFEGSVGHTFELQIMEFTLGGVLGNTELSAAQDRTYYGGTATVAKSVSENVELYADVSLTDSDLREKETQWGLGLSVKF